MAIKIYDAQDLTNQLGRLDFQISPNLVVIPKFEYQAAEFEAFKNVTTELQYSNCYLETSYDTSENGQPELAGLSKFNTNVLSRNDNNPFAFDRRIYFKNFTFYQNDGDIKDLDRADRFENIVITNGSRFYSEGRSLGKVFPNKINLNISNLGSTSGDFKSFLEANNYKYQFLHDIVQGVVRLEIREIEIDGVSQTVNFYDLHNNYTESSALNFENHVALAKKEETEIDIETYLTNFRDKMYEFGNETLFVRIKKLDNEKEIQNFWIYPNADGIVQYCDTQVKLDKEYKYQAYVYVLVVENVDDGGVDIDPSDAYQPRLYEIPLGREIVAKIIQPPHPRPQVQFKNIKNKKNKIKIIMNLSSNEYKSLDYRGVSEAEEDKFFDDYSKFDPFGLRDSLYQYETETGQFQIFKMERHPTSYYDIGNNAAVTEATSNFSTLVIQQDNILPFKDYYYMIRSFNKSRYYSNPSPIYKVHMTKDANDTFLHVETVDFHVSDQNKYMLEKTMAKLLQVVPSSYQTTLLSEDEDFEGYGSETNADQLPDLGIVDEKIWDTNTRFKLRLVSRKTGKKIDINLNFKLTKQITE